MKKLLLFVFLLMMLFSCEKAEEKKCWHCYVFEDGMLIDSWGVKNATPGYIARFNNVKHIEGVIYQTECKEVKCK